MRPIVGFALLLAALASAACHVKGPIPLDQVNVLKPDRAWVTESDNTVVLMEGPQVVGDTLVGYVNGAYEEMPVARFKQVVVQKGSTSKTVGLIAAVAVAFGGMAYALTGAKGDTKQCDPSYCEEHPEDVCCG